MAQVSQIGAVDALLVDIAHAVRLLLARGQGVLQHLAQIARAAVRGVLRCRPEGDGLDGTRADGEVLLHEELVLA